MLDEALESLVLLLKEALLLEVVSSIASEIVLEPLLQKIIDAATLLLDAERGSLFLHDPDSNELYSRVLGGASIQEIRFPADAGLAPVIVIKKVIDDGHGGAHAHRRRRSDDPRPLTRQKRKV